MSFREAMRRVITGDTPERKSVVVIDGGPSSEIGDVLFEFWEDAAVGNGTGREGSAIYRLTRMLETHVPQYGLHAKFRIEDPLPHQTRCDERHRIGIEKHRA